MPTINGSGTKTLPVNSNGFYVRFKTGKSTKYRVSVTFPYYRLGDQPISIDSQKPLCQLRNATSRGFL